MLLLTSKNRYSKQVLAILTQTRDSDISIVNVIEDIATFVLNFFGNFYKNASEKALLIDGRDASPFLAWLRAGADSRTSGCLGT
ncbi:hypothetical protein KSX_66740 [Ktedonospora formicarum]|uniref:Uncharacterized protein n=1 Tax=Ktedonospora formicarum TaxID=2778364 RepID=A0A8J3I6W1_9CHLR|nr:hypothetical protein KSX_66740 [Ktedonospora formicarum]